MTTATLAKVRRISSPAVGNGSTLRAVRDGEVDVGDGRASDEMREDGGGSSVETSSRVEDGAGEGAVAVVETNDVEMSGALSADAPRTIAA